jgi:hypothetical protein
MVSLERILTSGIRPGWRVLSLITFAMNQSAVLPEAPSVKPIRVGLTCWLWERNRSREIQNLAQRVGVSVKVSEKIHGLHREIEAQVSGRNVDHFIGEFARLA